jgi:hypothetical protein
MGIIETLKTTLLRRSADISVLSHRVSIGERSRRNITSVIAPATAPAIRVAVAELSLTAGSAGVRCEAIERVAKQMDDIVRGP